LKERFVLFTPLAAEFGRRRVIKLAYETSVGPWMVPPSSRDARAGQGGVRSKRHLTWTKFKKQTAIDPFETAFTTRALYGGASYHVEIEVPEELVISRAELGQAITRANHPRGQPDTTHHPISWEENVHRAHLYASNAVRPPSRGATGHRDGEVGYVALRLRLRTGVLWPPFMISLVTFVILVVGITVHALGIPGRPEATAPLLVAVPAIFAAYLIPGEHPLVRRMFKWLRILVLCSALLSFAAAGLLALSLSGRTTMILWIVLAVASAFCTGSVAASVKASWRRASALPRME
jgi:hypothetical protein